jgi:hypothetical protein
VQSACTARPRAIGARVTRLGSWARDGIETSGIGTNPAASGFIEMCSLPLERLLKRDALLLLARSSPVLRRS